MNKALLKELKLGISDTMANEAKPFVLLIEDNAECRQVISRFLADEFYVVGVANTDEGINIVREKGIPVTLLGVRDGLDANLGRKIVEFVAQVRELENSTKIIAYTLENRLPLATELIRGGVYDLLIVGVNFAGLRSVLWHASWAAQHTSRKSATAPVDSLVINEVIGISEKIRRVFTLIHKVAVVDSPVLITGETGTGKELAAKAIHDRSSRKHGPFVPINCSAIPESLLESELFGFERGAFTGATRQNKGRIEYAQGGTLFLDEVGELPLPMQSKILRFLQDRKITRIGGGQQEIQVETRVIAATNKNLRDAVRQDAFREDLYYRLAVVSIELPPLRERGDDVLLMANVFFNHANETCCKNLRGFTPEAVRVIKEYGWPGNVRELLNKIQRAVVMAGGLDITPEDLELPQFGSQPVEEPVSLKEARRRLGEKLLISSFTRHNGNLKKVAAELKISRPAVYYLLDKYGLREQTRSSH